MFRDVSGWEIWVTMKWHAPPKWPRWTCDTSYKCLEIHFIENPRLKVVWFQDVSRCFGVGNLGHYEMTRATKMTPVNLWYKLQMFGNPFHRDTPGRFAGNRIHPVYVIYIYIDYTCFYYIISNQFKLCLRFQNKSTTFLIRGGGARRHNGGDGSTVPARGLRPGNGRRSSRHES